MAVVPYAAAPALASLLFGAAQNPVARELGAADARYAWNVMRRRFPGVRQTAMARYGGNRGVSVPAYARMGQTKWFDTVVTSPVALGTGMTFDQLLLIPQGTTASTRIGNRIIVRSILYRCLIRLPPQTTGTAGSAQYRLMFVHDKQCNGATFAGGDLLVTNTSVSPMNLTNSQRFKMLMDKEGVIAFQSSYAPAGASTETAMWKEHKGFIKCNIPIEYSASTSAVTDIRSNNIVFGYIANNISANPDIVYYIRVRYDDPVR